MLRIIRLTIGLLVLVFVIGPPAEARIKRVAKSWNVIDLHGGYSVPIGTYHRIGILEFTGVTGAVVAIDADKVYEPTFHFGFDYGRLHGGHLLYSFGFKYTRVATLDTFVVDNQTSWVFTPVTPSFNQYDVDFNVNFLATDISRSRFAPYLGVSFHGGITSQAAPGEVSENWLTVAAGLNFGADLKVWGAPNNRAFVTLSTVNNVQVLASSHRPRYISLGGGLKYYFRL